MTGKKSEPPSFPFLRFLHNTPILQYSSSPGSGHASSYLYVMRVGSPASSRWVMALKPARVILSSLYMNRDTDVFTSCQFSRMARSPEIPSTCARDAAMAPPEVKTAMVFAPSVPFRDEPKRPGHTGFQVFPALDLGRVELARDPPQHGALKDPLEGGLAGIHLRQLVIQRWVLFDHIREQGRDNSGGVILIEAAQHLKVRHLSVGGTVSAKAPPGRWLSGAPWSPSRPHRGETPC